MTTSSVERFYSGKGSGEVTVRERGLSRALEPRAGSSSEEPRSFTWGRNETGATQLAFALLADALCDDAEARRWHQNFRRRVITNFPERWTITRSRILAHVQMMRYRGGGLGSSGQTATPRLKVGVRPANSD
jgi:hypothetical protein